ncbi:hypothetical protein [Frigidibacter sp.]|uniref:hypothetical protein n=1 Tax=Frigidibacter sp. TaxID=2586418 RepID=UPI0027334C20|nr:hypothetical protein [Frigidibacter sp.]MDP3342391.1 hypothetical protein [Frigidibacter sp.]
MIDGGLIFVTALLCLSGVGVWITRGPERFFDLLWSDLGFALILLPKIFGGILLATALGLSLPRARVLALIGPDSGWRGLMIAAVAGAVMPGGPHVIYPLTVALMAAGADMAAGVTIVSAWILLSLNRTLVWELSFIPVEFVAMRFLLTLPVPVMLGLVVRALAARAATR